MVNETHIIEQLKKGNKVAVHLWYKTYAPKLRRFFLAKVKHASDVDELTHDTFLSCLSSLPLYRGDAGLYGWMLSIARHELADYYRKLYAKKVISVLPLGEQLLDVATHETADIEHVVQGVLRMLPEAIRELLSLKYIDRLSVEKIAQELSTDPHAIQGRLYRARNAFKKAYKEMKEGYDSV